MNFTDKHIWITGASSGIGEALAIQWAAMGAKIIISSRRVAELERVKALCSNPDNVTIIPIDLADPNNIEDAANQVLQTFGYVDILVNNGGISQRGLVHETNVEVDRRIMEVDYFSGIILTKKVLPSMLQRKSGHFVNISSIVGKFGFPLRSAYAAAKHAMHGFYESLLAESSKDGIKVTMVCPARILTNVSLHALQGDGKEHGIMDHGQKNGITAETCAKKIIKAVRKNKKEVYIGRADILMIYFRRYIPWLYYKLASRVQPT